MRARAIFASFTPLALAVTLLLSGCAYSSNREAGTALGGGIGALTGAMIGEGTGHAFGGALIGGLAGGVVGSLVGENQDLRDERDKAVTYAQYLESTGQILTNSDIIRMVQSGLSDDVIIGTIKKSVGKYDLSPDGTIQLKAYGASDKVILALQKAPPVPTVSHASYSKARAIPSVGLVVAPAPVVMYGGPGWYGGRYYGCRRW